MLSMRVKVDERNPAVLPFVVRLAAVPVPTRYARFQMQVDF